MKPNPDNNPSSKKVRYYLPCLLLVAALLMSSCDNVNRKAYSRMVYWDDVMWERVVNDSLRPEIILDSLKTIPTERLSPPNKAYYQLLHTIAADKSYVDFENDSIIAQVVDYYRNSHDYRNLVRALYYDGLLLFRINNTDTLAYKYLKEAEDIYIRYNPNDVLLYGRLQFLIADMLFLKRYYDTSEKYIVMSMESFKEIGDTARYLDAKIEMVWQKIMTNKRDTAWQILQSIPLEQHYSPYTLSDIYNAYSGYYSSQKDYKQALEYEKKSHRIDASTTTAYYFGMLYDFLNYGLLDSAYVYKDLLESTLNNNTPKLYLYYIRISDYYQKANDPENALSYYKKAYDNLYENTFEISQNKILEMENRYDFTKKEEALAKMKYERTLFLVFFLTACIISLCLAFFIKAQRREKEYQRLITKFLMSSSKQSLNFIKQINEISAKHFTQKEYEKVGMAIQRHKTFISHEMDLLLEQDCIKQSYPKIVSRTDLSTKEKMIFILQEQNYNLSEIAEILHITRDNVRATINTAQKKEGNLS